jgi:hypothetical protein
MATLQVTLNITTGDAFTDTNQTQIQNPSKQYKTSSDSVLKRVKLTAAAGKLIFDATNEYGRSVLYLKMINDSEATSINIEDNSSTTIYASLLPGEFAFIPWHGTVDLYAEAIGGDATIEVGIFEI